MRVLSIVIHDNAGAGVFGEVPGVELVEWMPPTNGVGAGARRVRRGDGVRRLDARRPGGEASVASHREGAAARGARAGHAAARRLPGRPACSPRSPARVRTAPRRPRSAGIPVEVTERGPGRPAARTARARVRGVPVALLRVAAAARRHARSRATRPACRPSGWRTGRRGGCSSTPRSPVPTPIRGSTSSTTTTRRSATGLDPDVIRAETEQADRRAERARARAGRALRGGGAGHRPH